MKKISLFAILVIAVTSLTGCGKASPQNELRQNVEYIDEDVLYSSHEPSTEIMRKVIVRSHYVFTSSSKGYHEIETYYTNYEHVIEHRVIKEPFHYTTVDDSSILVTLGKWEYASVTIDNVVLEDPSDYFDNNELLSFVLITSHDVITTVGGAVYYAKDYIEDMGYSDLLSDYYK